MHYRIRRFAPAAAAAALILTACGDDDEAERADANLAVPVEGIAAVDGADRVIIYPVGTAASLETKAIRAEVERLQREQAGQTTPGGSETAGQTGGEAAGQTGGQTPGESGGGAGGGATSFAGVDRDNDARLSPAEYAIYNLPAETPARQGATNDEQRPFVSDEALNRSAADFRRLDANGDFFLSPEEFQRASR